MIVWFALILNLSHAQTQAEIEKYAEDRQERTFREAFRRLQPQFARLIREIEARQGGPIVAPVRFRVRESGSWRVIFHGGRTCELISGLTLESDGSHGAYLQEFECI